MPRESKGIDQVPDSERVFRGGAYLSHYRHIQNGIRRSTRCGFCSEGLGAVVTELKIDDRGNRVAPDNRGDKEGATPLPHSDGNAELDGKDDLQREDDWWTSQSPV